MNSRRSGFAAVVLVLGAGLFAAGTAARAQQRMMPDARAKFMVARIDRAVHLSPEQKTKIEAIYEQANTQAMQALRSGDREQIQGIFAQAQKDAQALCTPAQVAHWPSGSRR
ncbi:MAG: hypothetical protein ACRD1Y_05540 [Terriglobales bacterium]